MRSVTLAALVAILTTPGLAQDKPVKDDILQFKDGSIKVGRVTKIDATGGEITLKGDTKSTRFEFAEMKIYSVYEVKASHIDGESGKAHYDLGEYCQANGLYTTAMKEFNEARNKDASFADKAKKKIEECRTEDARTKFEDSKKLALEKKYSEANTKLSEILDKYSDTAYSDEAKKLMSQITEEIKKDNEEKQKQLDAKKKAEEKKEEKKAEDKEKFLLNLSVEAYEESQKAWAEGLDWEGKGNLTKADRAWKSGEAKLQAAKKNNELLLKSNDVETIKKTKDLDKQIDAALSKTYYRLGRMWATELNYPLALDYLNKGLKVPHDDQMDHLINEVLLTLSQLEMRKRATKGGY